MSMKNDMMLYLNMNDRLLGLNLREFIERHSSRPEFEVVSDFPNHDRRLGTNFRYRELGKEYFMIVFNSKLYVMTKNLREGGRFDLNVYCFDPTTDRKSIHLCDKSGVPRLMDGDQPIVFIHEEKFYALANPSCSSHFSYRRLGEEPQLFWVFDPSHECWKQLPHPLFDDDTYVYYEVSYDHKIFIDTFEQIYSFDAHQERWELWKDSDQQRRHNEKHNFSAIVKFDDGFLIAVTDQTNNAQNKTPELVAYKLDVKGTPQQHQALHEVHRMFPSRPLISNPHVVLGKCDDNLMWLVYCGKDNVQDFSCIGVAVFRVLRSYDNAGDVVFSVDIEAADFIDSNSYEVQDAKETTTLVYSASAMCHMHDNLETRDWFLYMDIGDRLCRLSISEFCKKRNSAFMSNFGVVHYLYPEGRPSTIPSRMRHIFVGSKVYLVGGQRLDRRIHCDVHGRCFAMPNLDIYALSYTEEGPSITLCQCEGSIPRLIDPRTKTIPITITVDDKIYVLAKRPYLGDAEELNDHDQPPLFKVFDPLKQSWKHLPHPPCYDISSRDIEPYVCNYFSWGHNLIIRTEAKKKKKKNRGTYIFDTHQEEWEDAKNMSEILDEGFRVTAEFQGFLIGMPYKRQELVAYHLDPNGMPKLSKVLDELQGIFSSCSLVSDCFLGKYDGDDRMWLVYSAQDSLKNWHARVAVFHVFISNDLDGNEVLCADLEAADFFQFDRFITSAFHAPMLHDLSYA